MKIYYFNDSRELKKIPDWWPGHVKKGDKIIMNHWKKDSPFQLLGTVDKIVVRKVTHRVLQFGQVKEEKKRYETCISIEGGPIVHPTKENTFERLEDMVK